MTYIPGSSSSKTKTGAYVPGSLSKRGASDPFFSTPFSRQEEVEEKKWYSTSISRIGGSFAGGVSGGLADFGKLAAWAGIDAGKSFSEKMDKWTEDVTPTEQTFLEKTYGGAGSMTLFFAPGLGAARGASMIAKVSPRIAKVFGGSTMAALEAGTEAGSVWDDNLKMGKSEEEANDRATKTFWANAVLGSITNRIGLFGDSKGILKRMLLSSSMEGVQEYGQTVISNVATDRKWDEGALEAGKIGFLLGGVFGSVNITTDTKGAVKKNIEDKLNISPEKATTFTNTIQTLQKEERKPSIFRDIKPGKSKDILNLLYTEPTTKIQDIVKPADRTMQIMRGEIKVEPVKKEKVEPVEVDRVKRVIEAERKQIKESIRTEDQKQAEYKRIGMEMSAIKRQLERKPTTREVEVTTKKLESIHTGKEVDYLGQKVVATGKVSFGRHEVKLKDGTTKYVSREDIKTKKITRGDAIKHLQEQAEIKLKGREEVFGLKPIKEVKPAKKKIKKEPKKVVKKEVIKEPTEREKAIDLSKKKIKPAKEKVRGLALGVETKAVANKLIEDLGNLPKYDVMDFANQAKMATELLATDPELAMDIAMGRKNAPTDLIPEAVFTAVENKAIMEGDTNTIRDLGTVSKLLGEATAMGQRISYLQERYKDSPVNSIKDVIATREDAFKGKVEVEKTKVANEIKKEIKKATPNKYDWSEFINKLKC